MLRHLARREAPLLRAAAVLAPQAQPRMPPAIACGPGTSASRECAVGVMASALSRLACVCRWFVFVASRVVCLLCLSLCSLSCTNTVFMRAAKVLQQLQCAFMLAVVSGTRSSLDTSKRWWAGTLFQGHRDAAGIDDSRWTNDAEPGLGPSLFPQTVEGWLSRAPRALASIFCGSSNNAA